MFDICLQNPVFFHLEGGFASRQKNREDAEDMGLRIDKTVEMLNNAGPGSLLVKVDESRIAIGRGMAMKIMVRRIS